MGNPGETDNQRVLTHNIIESLLFTHKYLCHSSTRPYIPAKRLIFSSHKQTRGSDIASDSITWFGVAFPLLPTSLLLSFNLRAKSLKHSSKVRKGSSGYRVPTSTSSRPLIEKLNWQPLMNISCVNDATTLSGMIFSVKWKKKNNFQHHFITCNI